MVTAAINEHWGVIERYLQRASTARSGRVLEDGIAGATSPGRTRTATAHTVMHAMVAWNHPALVETCIAQKGQTPEELRAQVAAMTEFVLRALRP